MSSCLPLSRNSKEILLSPDGSENSASVTDLFCDICAELSKNSAMMSQSPMLWCLNPTSLNPARAPQSPQLWHHSAILSCKEAQSCDVTQSCWVTDYLYGHWILLWCHRFLPGHWILMRCNWDVGFNTTDVFSVVWPSPVVQLNPAVTTQRPVLRCH